MRLQMSCWDLAASHRGRHGRAPTRAAVSHAVSHQTHGLQDDADHQQELYASIVNQLLMTYLMSPAGK